MCSMRNRGSMPILMNMIETLENSQREKWQNWISDLIQIALKLANTVKNLTIYKAHI